MKRFKPGDKARVIGRGHGHKFRKGQNITIMEVNEDDYRAEDKSGVTWWVKDSELQPIERNDEVIATQGTMPQGTEAGIPEPIEPVQEEESPWIDFEATEKLQFEMHKTVDMICEKTKVSYQDAANVYFLATIAQLASTISRLKSEIEELKRKA